jgi:hypothetical protein
MATDVRIRARLFREAIRRAQLKEWDPIGVGEIAEAQDEYDSYGLLPVLPSAHRSVENTV